MQEKTSNHRPMFVVDFGQGSRTEYYILDEGDSLPMNTSSNYDHHYQGPGIVVRTTGGRGEEKMEYYVNDPEAYDQLNVLVQLGIEKAKEMSNDEYFKLYDKVKKEMKERTILKSIHNEVK